MLDAASEFVNLVEVIFVSCKGVLLIFLQHEQLYANRDQVASTEQQHVE